jgi:hypothetical protein
VEYFYFVEGGRTDFFGLGYFWGVWRGFYDGGQIGGGEGC